MRSAAVPIWIAALVLSACRAAAPEVDAAPAAAPATHEASSTAAPAASPIGQLQAPSAADREIEGIVAERLAAGRYSYLRVDDVWIATTGDEARVGDHVRVQGFGARTDFESPRLGRRFDRLVFGLVQSTTTAKEGA